MSLLLWEVLGGQNQSHFVDLDLCSAIHESYDCHEFSRPQQTRAQRESFVARSDIWMFPFPLHSPSPPHSVLWRELWFGLLVVCNVLSPARSRLSQRSLACFSQIINEDKEDGHHHPHHDPIKWVQSMST